MGGGGEGGASVLALVVPSETKFLVREGYEGSSLF